MAPLAFQNDPDGTYRTLAAELRSRSFSFDPEEDSTAPSFEPIEEEDGGKTDLDESSTPAPPSRTRNPKTIIRALVGAAKSSLPVPSTPEIETARKDKNQKTIISAWIDDPDHYATEECRHVLELYAQLTDSEFSYVSDLQIIYDETRCFFLQWILGKEIKELVNSARISAVQMGNDFTWTHAREETLRTLTDVTLTARFLAVARLRRQAGTTAKLWISQVYTRKALLEDSKLGSPIHLPEALYLEILVGQMSAQETTVFDGIPSIGDDLLSRDARGALRYTLDKVKKSIDACSNPPYFRGVKTPITDLLDSPEIKPAKEQGTKEKRDQTKDKTNKKPNASSGSNTHDRSHLSRRPEHEQPTKFPEGLKRPDLEAVVDGKKIASEFQRQLYDDIKRGNCSRCHKGGHNRKDCKDPKAKWEEKFDKEQLAYWTSVLKWQQRATQQKSAGTATPATTKPPTLHVKTEAKPEQRFFTLTYDEDDDDEDYDEPMQHFRATMTDPDDDDDDDAASVPPGGHINVVNDGEDMPDAAHLPDDVNDFDGTGLEGPVTHVTAILRTVDAQLRQRTPAMLARARYPHIDYANIDTLLHDPFFTTVLSDPDYSVVRFPTGLIASCLTTDLERARAHFVSLARPSPPPPRRRATPRYVPESGSPPRDPDYVQDDITYDPPSAFRSSSVSVPLRPTKPRSPPPLPDTSSLAPISPHQWGDAPLSAPVVAPTPWQPFVWGNEIDHNGPEPEPRPWGSRRPPSRSSSESYPDEFPYYDEDITHLQQYVQTASSFIGGTTVNAIAHVRDTRDPDYPLATRSLLLGLDSYSDVTVAHRDIVYDVRPVHENLSTGGGKTAYYEEGLVDIVDGPCSFRTIPALVAHDPSHLPAKCLLLLGVPQINELDIKLDTHRLSRRLPLQSYNPAIDFSADTHLQCHLSEKDLSAWADHNPATSVGSTTYSHLDVIYDETTRTPDEILQLRAASAKYQKVYNAAKGALPALANHPPVTLNFKDGWKHVSVPVPKWGPGATAVLTRWAREMLESGLYTLSKSPSASRPHIVRKTPQNAPKDVDIRQCGLRVCGDYRMANDQLQKSFPSTANGTDELSKLPGYALYWCTDRFSMYNAYRLEPGPSRELLAVHTPLGLIEPTRMVFGEMNAGTVACAATPATLQTLPHSAYRRTAAYVDDHAQGSHTFADLLQGYTDFLALCDREDWTLNATENFVGFPSCVFFGFHVDKSRTCKLS